jgi:hypothetical protein
LKTIALIFLGTVIAFGSTILHEWLGRLRQFRAKILVIIARLEDTPADKFDTVYESTRLEVLEACAVVRPDIYRWRRRRFDSSANDYCNPAGDDRKQFSHLAIHALFPESYPMPLDQRTPKERRIVALSIIKDCV